MSITVRRSDVIFGVGARIDGWHVFGTSFGPILTADDLSASSANAEIDCLYEELARLPPGDPRADDLSSRLLRLEEAELDRIQSAFEQRLSMPLSAGRDMIDKIDRLLTAHADPSSTNKSP